jgi:S-adenosylmethionine decarboxylase
MATHPKSEIRNPTSGLEWVIEAHGCDGAGLAELPKLRALFKDLVAAMALRPVGEPVWHQFPTTGGITGLCLLAESHLACHTFPEHQSICLNVFCCQPRPDWDFAGYFKREFGATAVNVRRIERPYTHERESRQLPELRRADQVPLV